MVVQQDAPPGRYPGSLAYAPATGHLTGETRKGGDAINALFDQMPEDTILCLTLVATPQDSLESRLNHLGRKAGGRYPVFGAYPAGCAAGADEYWPGPQTLPGGDGFLSPRTGPSRTRGPWSAAQQRHAQCGTAAGAGGGRGRPLNSYLRWLPAVFSPAQDKRQWYTQLMFAQHAANLVPLWGRGQGTGHPGITFFNRGGETVTFDPLNRLDRQMNAHLFLFGPTGSGKSATLNNILNQVTAIYRPRLFIVEAGNSFGLFGDFAQRLGLSVHRVKLAPGAGVSLAPFVDAKRLVDTPSQVWAWTRMPLTTTGTPITTRVMNSGMYWANWKSPPG